MSMNDLLSDFIARVRNAKLAGKTSVKVKKNKVVLNSIVVLTKMGYFHKFNDLGYEVEVELNSGKIQGLKRISKPGRRLYFSYDSLPRISDGIGYNILSTSKGVKTSVEAKRDMIGGELIFQIW